MKSYSAIKAEIAKLEKQAELARKTEVAGVVSRIKEAIATYGLTAADLGLGRSAPARKASGRVVQSKAVTRKTTGVPKYHDPATGKTWTGQGRPPDWIANAADRGAFLIASRPAEAGTSAKSKVATKDGRGRRGAVRGLGSKRTPAAGKVRSGRKASVPASKTAAVQIESGAASA